MALWILLFCLFCLRKPDNLLAPQFYSEDACIFFHDQVQLGLRSLVEPYNGYLSLVPRIVALLASPLDIATQPLFYNLAMLLLQAAAFTVLFLPAYRYLISSDLLRAAMCLAMVAAFQGTEMIGTISNVQWPLLMAALLLLFQESSGTTTRGNLIRAAVVFVIGLTAPILVIALPFSLWRLLRKPNHEKGVAFLFSLAAIIQLALFLITPKNPGAPVIEHYSAAQIALGSAAAFLYRVVLAICFGVSTAQAAAGWQHRGAFLLLLGVGVVAWLVWLWIVAKPRRWQILTGCYLMAASIAVTLAGRGLIGYFLSVNRDTQFYATRYFLLSSAVMVLFFGFTIEWRMKPTAEFAKAACLLAIVAGGMITNFSVPAYEDLRWTFHAERIRAELAKRRTGAQAGGLFVPINPPPLQCILP